MNLKILRNALARVCKSWRVSQIEIGDEALHAFDEARSGGDGYGLVIMDEHFDARSSLLGTEVIRNIRQIERRDGGAACAVIICSGNVHDESDRATNSANNVYYEAGANEVWCKPYPSFVDGMMQRGLARALAAAGVAPCAPKCKSEAYCR
jgi:CheY-like chemotaxis protein